MAVTKKTTFVAGEPSDIREAIQKALEYKKEKPDEWVSVKSAKAEITVTQEGSSEIENIDVMERLINRFADEHTVTSAWQRG